MLDPSHFHPPYPDLSICQQHARAEVTKLAVWGVPGIVFGTFHGMCFAR
jgi:hypothetical protein